MQRRGSDDDRSSASAAGSFCSSFLQTGDRAESTRKDSHWPIAAQGSFQWENEPGPNQVSPLGRETRPILVSPVGQRLVSPVGQVTKAKPGQSSGKRNHCQTRPMQVTPVGRGTRAKPGHSGAKMNQRETRLASGKRNEANPGQSSGKRNQGETRSVQCDKEPGRN
ncbi:unnamed protein product [Sphagnum balticum]